MVTTATALPEGTVTVLFTDVVESTDLTTRVGDETARRLLRGIEEAVRAQVLAHHGVEVKGMGDGQMVAFQSARRAVACAVDIQRAVARKNRQMPGERVDLRIGLNTGEVLPEDADLFGATVNAAARIAAKAGPGEILIPAEVVGVLGRTSPFELEAWGEAELRGFAEPWELFRVRWEDQDQVVRSDELTPLIGRGPEGQALVQAIRSAREGRGGLVFVAGEAGVGKTRMTLEAVQEARRAGLLTLVGHAHDRRGAAPFAPFVEMMDRVTRIVAPAALRAALGDAAPEVSRVIPRLRSQFDDIPHPLPVSDDQAKAALLDALRDFVRRAASVQPVLMVWEDLHWADEATLDLVAHLAACTPETPLLMIATFRDTAPEFAQAFRNLVQDLERRRLAVRQTLRRLDRGQVAGMLRALAAQEAPADIVDEFYRETDGLPFFVEEVFQHFTEEGRLVRADGTWAPDFRIEEDEVPENVQTIVARRLAHVSDDCRDLLGRTATAGRMLPFELIRRIVDVDDEVLIEALEEAERAHLLRETSVDGQDGFEFGHELIRQTLLASVSSPRRRRQHATVARALVSLHGHDLPAVAGEIAEHLVAAEGFASPPETAQFLDLAGQRAMDSQIFTDAAIAFRRAIDAAPTDSERVSRLCRLGDSLRRAGQPEQAIEVYQEAVSAATQSGTPSAAAEAAIGLEQATVTTGKPRPLDGGPSVRLLEQTLEPLPEGSAIRARVRASLAQALHFAGNRERALRLSEEAVAEARRSGDAPALASALNSRRIAIHTPERLDELLAVATEAKELAAEVGDLELQLENWNTEILALYERGEVARADTESEAYAAFVSRVRDPFHALHAPHHRSCRARREGDLARAEREIERLQLAGEEAGTQNAFLFASMQLMWIRRLQGRQSELIERFRDLGDRVHDIPAFLISYGVLCAEGGQVDEGARVFEEFSHDRFVSIPRDNFWITEACLLSDLCYALDDGAAAGTLYELLQPFADRFLMSIEPLHLPLGQMATLLGDWPTAELHYREALARARAVGSVAGAEIAQCRLALMLFEAERTDEAHEVAAASRDTLMALGMTGEARRLHAFS